MTSERGVFAEEYRIWHTPAIGAYLFWRFATIYVTKSRDNALPSCLHFFILAGVLRDGKIVNEYIHGSRTLLTLVKAIKKKGDADLIDALHDRVRKSMDYTSSAIDLAVAAGMLEWDAPSAALRPLKVRTSSGTAGYRDSEYFKNLVSSVEKLARMFAAIPSVGEIAALLRVRL